jgi:hypothetical protein
MCAPARAEKIPLTVDFGVAGVEFPHFVRGGIPVAQGVMKTPDAARLLEDGKEVPLQTRKLASWSEGSVKWLLVDFQAAPGRKYELEFGDAVKRAAVDKPIKTEATDASASVDTGVLRFTVNKSGCGFIDELWYDFHGDGKYGDDEKVVSAADAKTQRNFLNYLHVEKSEDYPAMSHFAKGVIDRSRVRIDELTVEEQGPIRVCVRIRGHYLYDKVGSTCEFPPKLENQFTVRIHAYRNSGLIRAEHTFVYEGDPDHDFVRTMGLALDVKPLAGALAGTSTGRTEADVIEKDAAAGVYVPDADTVETWTVKDRQNPPQAKTVRERISNWVALDNLKWSVTCGIRNGWKLYPNSVWAERDTGRLAAYLYPPEARPLDMRRYGRDEFGVGEGGGYETEAGKQYPELPKFSRMASRGIGRSHDVIFYFNRGGSGAPDWRDVMAVFDAGAIVRGPLDYMANTHALGYYAPFGPGPYEDVWKSAAKELDYSLAAQERFGWYGFFDFGDQQSRYNFMRSGRYETDWGRWGWGNNDGIGRYSYAFALYYLCTGERKYFDALEAAARHNTDVDIIHTQTTIVVPGDTVERARGLSHRHDVQHWSETYIGLRGSTCVGWRIYYFLTGEERLRDVLEEVAECAMTDHYACSGGVDSTDGGGSASMALLTMWEITGDEKYREKLKWKIGKQPVPENSWIAGLAHAMGLYEAFINYYDLSGGYDKAKEHMIKGADFTLAVVPKPGQTYPFDAMRGLSEAFRITGEAKYRDHIVKMLDEYRKFLAGDPRVKMDAKDWPGWGFGLEIENSQFNRLAALPWALWAAGQEVKK